jgi:hypothetical protein
MSKFDIDKLLAQAGDDLDAESKTRVTAALRAAVSATEAEVTSKAEQATQEALGALRASLEGLTEVADGEMGEAIKKASYARSALIRAIQDAESIPKLVEQRVNGATDQALSKAKTIGKDLEGRLSKETARADALRKELDVIKAQSLDLSQARKWALAMLGAAALIVLAAGLIGWVWSARIVAEGRAELDQQVASLTEQITVLEAETDTARLAGIEMADLRDQIGVELNRFRELREEIGLELVRDDRVVEIRLGDVILRPWRGRTLVITDEGRQLEAFSGGAALNDVARYAGRMWRTTDAN